MLLSLKLVIFSAFLICEVISLQFCSNLYSLEKSKTMKRPLLPGKMRNFFKHKSKGYSKFPIYNSLTILSATDLNIDKDFESADILLKFDEYLRNFFNSNCNKNSKISFNSLLKWNDFKELLDLEIISIKEIEKIWHSVLDTNKNINFKTFRSISQEERENDDYTIDFNSFKLFNKKIELQLENLIKKSSDSFKEYDLSNFLTQEFFSLAKGGKYIGIAQILSWSIIKELVDNNELEIHELLSLWKSYPKTKTESSNPLAQESQLSDLIELFKIEKSVSDLIQEELTKNEGITLDDFLSFNNKLENLIESKNITE